jgi:hypothetical protein
VTITADLHLYRSRIASVDATKITAELYFYKSEVRGNALTIELATGFRGAIGPQGPSGTTTTVIAAEALGGHRAVTVQGLHCSPSTADELAGVTTGATALGDVATYISAGLMEESSWNWTPGQPVFLGAAGVLTQTPLTSGPVRRIAWAVAPTKINVDFLPPITQA